MDKAYNHKDVEEKLYNFWEKSGYFKPDSDTKKQPYSMVLPPPNVTGTLHIGHALMLVIQDILIRYHRMKGFRTLWVPGTDHAAIATQSKVEGILYKEEEKTRFDLGREEFLKRVEAFAQTSHDTIVNQIRRIGASVDWEREAYTLDTERNFAVRTAFVRMFQDGLIYRGDTIVNWDPKMKTTVSDDEIEWKEEQVPFYYLQYGPFVIATARPETKFGDKYVVMHPKDSRYLKYKHGEKIEVEWINGKVTATIIKDDAVDMKFGTGVMTITPWHDRTDFEIATRHTLDMEQVIDFNAQLLPIAGDLAGQHIKKARPLIVERLREKGLVVKVDEEYVHRIAINYRGGGVIEPQIKKQWMVNVNKSFTMQHSSMQGIKDGDSVTLKQLMKHAVSSGQIAITPQHFIKTYYHWIDNLRDWCISRQIWYGHRIPVWYKGEKMHVGTEAPEGEGWEQDQDTLDTWFSSGLWTFSTLGWPKETKDLRDFHPTSVLETGYDILFFWVARMILMSTYLLGEVPFRQVLLHGLVRDANKQKMSKSKGNVIDPLEISEKYGTDALRIALIYSTAAGNDIPMSEDKVRGMKFFANKLWNIGRFIEMKRGDLSADDVQAVENIWELRNFATHETDKEIIEEAEKLIEGVTEHIASFRLHEAAQLLYQFVWHTFADTYIEDVKTRLDAKSYVVLHSLFLQQLRLLHPFMPFITEEIYQTLPGKKSIPSLMIAPWPTVAELPHNA